MATHIDSHRLQNLVHGGPGDPFELLGLHPLGARSGKGYVVRGFLPEADGATVVVGDRRVAMERIHPEGVFEAAFPRATEPFEYRLEVTHKDGRRELTDDPYRFWPFLSDYDLHLIGEGRHYRLYERLGGRLVTHQGVAGASFGVWAPNAESVSVIGGFNGWDPRRHRMRARGSSGVWEIFIPGLEAGALYKFHIRSRSHGQTVAKADPLGLAMEMRPRTASVLHDLERYQWNDGEWMARRREAQGLDRPISVYEVHLGSWQRHSDGQRWLTYRELAERLVPYAVEMGYTHLELLPVSEHPFDASWGYQTIGHYAPTARFGGPDDFRAFVDRAHQAGLGVLLDWVPAHFPRDEHGLAFFDGTHLYEHADPRKGQHQDWGTLIFNYGRNEVSNYLLANALFWLDRYHIDGLRVDAVASMLYLDYSRNDGEWVPNRFGGRENLEAVEFLKHFNVIVHEQFPDVLTIAEESTAWPMVSRPVYLGGLGFDLKWNMGWMHDTLVYMSKDPVYRQYEHNKLTFSLFYAWSENFMLPLSHDEVVHGKGSLINKMPGDYWKKFANLRALYGYMYTHPGKKLLFMGGELGQWSEWNHDTGLDWVLMDFDMHRKLRDFVRALNHLYRGEPALYEIDFHWDGFQWIDCRDVAQSVVSWIRRGRQPDEHLVMVANLTPVVRPGYRVGVPTAGPYREALNSDAPEFGGSGVLNPGDRPAMQGVWQEQPWSITLDLPPLALLVMKPAR